MLTQVRITNFRCFEQTQLRDLKRVNLVIGPNGSGKTALLEALFFLLGGNPEVALRLKAFRGLIAPTLFRLSVRQSEVARLWDDLFFRFDRERSLEIEAEDVRSRTWQLVVALAREKFKTIPLGDRLVRVDAPVSFDWRTPEGRFEIRPFVTEDGLHVEESPHPAPVAFIPAHFRTSAEESAQRLSDLSKRNLTDQVLAPLRQLFPEVSGISVENEAGNWSVYFELSPALPKIPAVLHSAGVGRYLDYLLCIATREGGVVLIDEFDNGLYYGTLERAWRGLFDLAESRQVQVFATTHSRECIEATLPLLKQHEEGFNVIRMGGGGGRRVTVERLDPRGFAAAVEQGYEVR